MNNFCVFILTHGRPDKVYTYKTLQKHGYTGKIYLVIDNEDSTADDYYKMYGDYVIMFDKAAIAKTFDEGDNFQDRRTIVYARNACFQIAKELGIRYFLQLDDDYTKFCYKEPGSPEIWDKPIKNLDKIFKLTLTYYRSIETNSIAFSQNGDFLGGTYGNAAKNPCFRKCMNTFFCDVNRQFQFVGRVNEDVNTYTELGRKGKLFLSIPNVSIIQKATQKTKGGMSDVYTLQGTYVKSFYTVMYAPSCTKIKLMQSRHPRLHHAISWRNAVPVIIREKHKKQYRKQGTNDWGDIKIYSREWYAKHGVKCIEFKK